MRVSLVQYSKIAAMRGKIPEITEPIKCFFEITQTFYMKKQTLALSFSALRINESFFYQVINAEIGCVMNGSKISTINQ